MGSEKNHLYSIADVTYDSKKRVNVKTQQQFSRYSITNTAAIIAAANVVAAQQQALQGLANKPPIGQPYDDTIGIIGLVTQAIFLDVYGSQYSFVTLNNDADFGFENIPQGKFIEFTLDILIDTGGSPAAVAINFPVDLINPPVLPGTDGDHYILKFVGVNRADQDGVDAAGTTTFTLIGGTETSGGGGGISFPARPPVDNRGLVTTNQDFILSNPTGHVLKMELGDNIDITFNNFPINNFQQEWEVELKQDSTGGRTVTWPASVVNPPIIDLTPDVTTIVVFRTNDAGTTIRVANTVSTGIAADLSLWANFQAVNDINFATFDGNNIDRLFFITGGEGTVLGTDYAMYVTTNNDMAWNVPDQREFHWSSDNSIILRLDRFGVNNDTNLIVQTPDTEASAVPSLVINRIDPTPSKDTDIALIQFQGTDAATDGGAFVSGHLYSEIKIEYESVISGREASSMAFITSFDTGAATQFIPFLGLNLENSGTIHMLKDTDLEDNSLLRVNTLELQDTGTFGAILFNATGARDTFISNDISNEDDIFVTNNGSLNVNFGFSPSKSIPFMGFIPNGSSFLNLTSNFMAVDPLTEPIDGIVQNGEGLVYFDNSTDPGILFIKKKNSGGTPILVSLEQGGGSGANTALSNLADPTALNQDLNMLGNEITLDADKDTFIDSVNDDTMQFTTGASLRFQITNSLASLTVPLSLLNANKITNALDPTSAQDLATKNYVDTTAAGDVFLANDQTFTGINTFDDTTIFNKFLDLVSSATTPSNKVAISSFTGDMYLNVLSSDSYFFRENGAVIVEMDIDGVDIRTGWLEMTEISTPPALANHARLFVDDNGAGKTRLMVQFGSGAAQQVAIEP